MGNWSTCNVTTRGSIYDTSHYYDRIVRLFGYLFIGYLLQSKYVSETGVAGLLTI
jgi:hypothetical protein